MKKSIFILSLVFIIVLPLSSQVFWQDDFGGTTPEMGGGTRVSSVGSTTDGICCGFDRFVRSDEFGTGTCCGCNVTFLNLSGAWAWGGEDLDGTAPCISAVQTLTWTGINISGRTNLEFIGLFGIRDNTSWEGSDELKIQYRIDAGPLTDGICFIPEGGDIGFDDLALDANCDGIIDAPLTTLTTTLSEFTFSIPGTGATLELIFTASASAAGEEFVVDNFRLNEGEALPVALTNFDGFVHNKTIKLNWTTVSEINNEGFEVEHSINGRNWTKLGFVLGNDNSTQINKYDYIHNNPKRQINYYRLKQIDFDGQFEYSKVINIDFQGKDKYIGEFYPNPAKSGLVNLHYTSQKDKEITVSVFSVEGKLVVNKIQQVPTGSSNLGFDFSYLDTGIYIVKIGDKGDQIHRKLIIEK